MSFGDAVNRMFALYGQQDYEAALRVVRQARNDYPEQDNRLTFWAACLLARAGEPGESVAVLSSGVERGEWWPTGQLADADLDPIRSTAEFKEIVARCEAITAERKADRPAPIVSESTTGGTLVSIQGAHADQTELASLWQRIVPSGWGVITPPGSEPIPEGGWTWPHSLELSVQNVLDDLEGLEVTRPFVLSGFSLERPSPATSSTQLIDRSMV